MSDELAGHRPQLSIVIPAFNEAQRIGPTLEKIIQFFEARRDAVEILVVDDGSTDATDAVVKSFGYPTLKVLRNPHNRGKGYSVREGFLKAQGRWVLLTDADLSTPIEELDVLLEAAHGGADLVIGSRAIDRSKILVHQSHFRELAGIVYNRIVRLVLRLPISDTQCGFKLFNREACIPVFKLQRIERFGFDPEILYLARKRGLTIGEVPVIWRNDTASKVQFLRDAARMFLDLIRIRWNWMTGRYLGLA